MIFPGRTIKMGDVDQSVIQAIQKQLNSKGCGPIEEDGFFGEQTLRAVKFFQLRFVDAHGQPLKVDGSVGAITWATLFPDSKSSASVHKLTSVIEEVVKQAKSQVGVLEQPIGSNGGPQIDQYLKSVGLDTGYFWCAAFVYWCFEQACAIKKPQSIDRLIKTAGVIDHWNRAVRKGVPIITQDQAVNNTALIKPGLVFIMDYGKNTGHTGIVVGFEQGKLITIEGNTAPNETSNNGIGVFQRNNRTIGHIQRGFIDYENYL